MAVKLEKFWNRSRAGLMAVPYVVVASYGAYLLGNAPVAFFPTMFLGLAVINVGTYASRRISDLADEIATLRAQLAATGEPGDRVPERR